jgi:hypothetical protein
MRNFIIGALHQTADLLSDQLEGYEIGRDMSRVGGETPEEKASSLTTHSWAIQGRLLKFVLLIYGLFLQAVNSSYCPALNERMINELEKVGTGSGQGLIFGKMLASASID